MADSACPMPGSIHSTERGAARCRNSAWLHPEVRVPGAVHDQQRNADVPDHLEGGRRDLRPRLAEPDAEHSAGGPPNGLSSIQCTRRIGPVSLMYHREGDDTETTASGGWSPSAACRSATDAPIEKPTTTTGEWPVRPGQPYHRVQVEHLVATDRRPTFRAAVPAEVERVDRRVSGQPVRHDGRRGFVGGVGDAVAEDDGRPVAAGSALRPFGRQHGPAEQHPVGGAHLDLGAAMSAMSLRRPGTEKSGRPDVVRWIALSDASRRWFPVVADESPESLSTHSRSSSSGGNAPAYHPAPGGPLHARLCQTPAPWAPGRSLSAPPVRRELRWTCSF